MAIPSLFFHDSWRFQIIGRGRKSITRSVAILGTPIAIEIAKALMHFLVPSGLFHKESGGVHAATEATKKLVPLAIRNAINHFVISRARRHVLGACRARNCQWRLFLNDCTPCRITFQKSCWPEQRTWVEQ